MPRKNQKNELTKYLHVYCPNIKKGGARNGGEFRRPVNVYVVLCHGMPYRINGKNILAAYLIANNVDGRYSGDRSAYGRALSKAWAMRKDTSAFLKAVKIHRNSLRYKKIIAEIVALRMQGGA